ncbi:unnamed protein product [Danaus chrysippus]|uniref:(African queen) hypothetical protein n=1 Tax=Danaus chrysippus TaxID=151541 RepID=A0A8J2QZ18_9NEOP|nr:unnamed protein product [Danaus chrysippus]
MYSVLDATNEHTVSSASLCMSPESAGPVQPSMTSDPPQTPLPSAPLHASTPLHTNGYRDNEDDKRHSDTVNGNIHVNVVSASTNNMDVLSGGESDAGDTLSRRNNNSISSGVVTSADTCKKHGADVTYYVAKELLMTERTYKRDLELVTVTWSKRVSSMGRVESSGSEAAALGRACLALEPLALPVGALLAKLDRALAPEHIQESRRVPFKQTITNSDITEADMEGLLSLPAGPLLEYLDRILSSIDLPIYNGTEEPEYKAVAELLHDYLTNTYDAYKSYISSAGTTVGLVESARRRGGAGSRHASAFDAASPLPLTCLLLRPLHRLHHYQHLADELCRVSPPGLHRVCRDTISLCRGLCRAADEQLTHVENHATLCQLQRDLLGYDKLLVADREFVRLGCVYKHSSKGLQQRMLFLFSDILILSSKSASGHFRAHSVLATKGLAVDTTDNTHTLTVTGEDTVITLSTSNETEFRGWFNDLTSTVDTANKINKVIDTELTPYLQDYESSNSEECSSPGASSSGNALAHVCWHRATSLSRRQLHLAMRSQLSGYLLRKFKNSHGWQKLWVVFALCTLFFYKTGRDSAPLASLPLLGYSVGPPSAGDGIDKDFVFKLQFKNHVYFFRADSHYTYNRWIEVLQTPMAKPHLT